MDEPFGAIDPITRERLQDEFLRLQAEVRKTVVFVTHDIDEAVKLGDRIAILREGGISSSTTRPRSVLGTPATPFVADFVGADRGAEAAKVTGIDVASWRSRRSSHWTRRSPRPAGRWTRDGPRRGPSCSTPTATCTAT